jgi:hypothetical protein
MQHDAGIVRCQWPATSAPQSSLGQLAATLRPSRASGRGIRAGRAARPTDSVSGYDGLSYGSRNRLLVRQA